MQDTGQKDLFVKNPVWWEGLKNRQKLFVEYYCTDRTCFLNATAAYIKAYGSGGKELAESSIQSNASRLMRDTTIKLAIAKLLQSQQNDEDRITEYRLLNLLHTLAFYNPKDIINKQGSIEKELEALGDLALCITGIKKTKNGTEIKLYDRTKAMEILYRYLDIVRSPEGATVVSPVVYISKKDIEALNEKMPEAEDAEFEVIDNQEFNNE